MTELPINLAQKLSLFTEHWSPRVVAEFNDYQLKLVKLQGEFVWHAHPETDEVFFVISGHMDILFRDGQVTLKAGEMFVVEKGRVHKPVASQNATSCSSSRRRGQYGRRRRCSDSSPRCLDLNQVCSSYATGVGDSMRHSLGGIRWDTFTM